MVHVSRAPALLGLFASVLACAATQEVEHEPRGGCIPERSRHEAESPEAMRAVTLDREAAPCSERAAAHDGFGEVEIAVRAGPRGELAEVKIEKTGTLTDADADCVAAAVRRAVAFDGRGTSDFTRVMVLGRATPLLPPVDELVRNWRAARHDAAARARLAQKLPPAVAVSDDGCLLVESGRAPERQVDAWTETLPQPLPHLWQPRPEGPGLFQGLRPDDAGEGRWMRAFWLGKDTILLSGVKVSGGTHRRRVCLLSLGEDAEARAEMNARIARRGSCWSAKTEDVLLRPRTDFPADGRYVSVASTHDRACAVDADGAVVCCGAPGRLPPATLRFLSLALGEHVDCGLTSERDVHCWGDRPPLAGKTFAGPFDQISSDGEVVCALNSRTRAIECWNSSAEGGLRAWAQRTPPPPRLTRPFGQKRFIGLSTPAWGTVCGLTEDRWLTCRIPPRDLLARYPQFGFPGAFTSFSISPTEVCGVTAANGHVVRCFLTWPSEDKPNPTFTDTVIDGDEVVAIAQVDYQVCFLKRDQSITCWPGKRGTPRFPDRYRAISGGRRICAIDLRGAITCDRGWPTDDMLDTKYRY